MLLFTPIKELFYPKQIGSSAEDIQHAMSRHQKMVDADKLVGNVLSVAFVGFAGYIAYTIVRDRGILAKNKIQILKPFSKILIASFAILVIDLISKRIVAANNVLTRSENNFNERTFFANYFKKTNFLEIK